MGIENESQNLNSIENHTNIPPIPETSLKTNPGAPQGMLSVVADSAYVRLRPEEHAPLIGKVMWGMRLIPAGEVVTVNGVDLQPIIVYIPVATDGEVNIA